MGFARSAGIFQAEMGNLMAALDYVWAYIDDLLVITKGSYDNHLNNLEQVFIKLLDAGLKVDATKLFFCTVHLTSIHHPQIEGEFTATPGGLTNLFYGCKD